jgi:hypothetical protein
MWQIEMEGHEPMTVSKEDALKLAQGWCDQFEVNYDAITEKTIKWLGRFPQAILINDEIFAVELAD